MAVREPETFLIIIERNGQRIVIIGWRAWLLWLAIIGPAMLLVGATMVAAAGLFLGIALTLTTIAVFALPLAFVLTFIISFFRAKKLTPKKPRHLP